ncbi:MAG: hypothetical protein VCC04_04060 [Myxococcota bacterium]
MLRVRVGVEAGYGSTLSRIRGPEPAVAVAAAALGSGAGSAETRSEYASIAMAAANVMIKIQSKLRLPTRRPERRGLVIRFIFSLL